MCRGPPPDCSVNSHSAGIQACGCCQWATSHRTGRCGGPCRSVERDAQGWQPRARGGPAKQGIGQPPASGALPSTVLAAAEMGRSQQGLQPGPVCLLRCSACLSHAILAETKHIPSMAALAPQTGCGTRWQDWKQGPCTAGAGGGAARSGGPRGGQNAPFLRLASSLGGMPVGRVGVGRGLRVSYPVLP